MQAAVMIEAGWWGTNRNPNPNANPNPSPNSNPDPNPNPNPVPKRFLLFVEMVCRKIGIDMKPCVSFPTDRSCLSYTRVRIRLGLSSLVLDLSRAGRVLCYLVLSFVVLCCLVLACLILSHLVMCSCLVLSSVHPHPIMKVTLRFEV
jgi:hypothetical protein